MLSQFYFLLYFAFASCSITKTCQSIGPIPGSIVSLFNFWSLRSDSYKGLTDLVNLLIPVRVWINYYLYCIFYYILLHLELNLMIIWGSNSHPYLISINITVMTQKRERQKLMWRPMGTMPKPPSSFRNVPGSTPMLMAELELKNFFFPWCL